MFNKREYLRNTSEFCEKMQNSCDKLWNGMLFEYAPCVKNQGNYAVCLGLIKECHDAFERLSSITAKMSLKESV